MQSPSPASSSSSARSSRGRRSSDAQIQQRRYERAIKKHGDTQAMLSLAKLLQAGAPGIKRDPLRAHQLFQRAATQKPSVETLNKLADSYLHNMSSSVSKSAQQSRRRVAVDLLQQSLYLEDTPDGLHDSAVCMFGDYCKQDHQYDPDRAVQLLERAITRFGSSIKDCLPCLAFLLASDQVSNPDPVRAVALYKRYIKLTQDPRAMHNLGLLYEHGKPPLKPNLRRARIWYERTLKNAPYPYARARLAIILSQSSHPSDTIRAVQLLEQTITEVDCEPAVLLLAGLYDSTSVVTNYARAVRLYRQLYHRFGNRFAAEALAQCLLEGRPGVLPNPCQAFRLLVELYSQTRDTSLRPELAELLWSGTATNAADRTRAVQMCRRAIQDNINAYISLASMLRYGHAPVLEASPYEALRVLELIPCDHSEDLYLWKNMMLAIVLSEVESPYPQLLSRVYDMLHKGIDVTPSSRLSHWSLWLPIYLRKSSIGLPVSSCPHRITHAVMNSHGVPIISILNTSSLLLEGHNILPGNRDAETAVSLLESGVKKFNNHLLRVKLAYVLWYGIGGIDTDPDRAIQLVEGVMLRSPHQLARAVLSCMLAERGEKDVPRAVDLWSEVTRSLRDVDEVRRLSMVISAPAKSAIEKYSQQSLLRHHAPSSLLPSATPATDGH